MLEVAPNGQVLTKPRNNVKDIEEKMPKRHPESATNVPANSERRCEMKQYKQPLLVKYAPGVLESSSFRSYAWKETLPTRMLIWKEDAANIVRLRVPSDLLARGTSVMLSRMVLSTPPAQQDYVDIPRRCDKPCSRSSA